MAKYDLKSFERYGDAFRPTGGKDYKKAVKKGKDVVGKSGSSKAPKGYYQSGTTSVEGRDGGRSRTYAIYSKLPEQKSEKKKSKPKNKQKKSTKTQAKAAPVTQPTNQYQSQIDEILAGISNLSNQQTLPTATATPDLRTADPNADAIASLNQRMADQQANFENQLAQIAQQQAQQQAEAERRAQMEEQKRQMELRISQANTARSGQTPDFRIGAGAPRDQYGTDAFKRQGRQMASKLAGATIPLASTFLNI